MTTSATEVNLSSSTAFPASRFTRVGATSGQLATLQAWWNTLTAMQQEFEVSAIASLPDSAVITIVTTGYDPGLASFPNAPGFAFTFPAWTPNTYYVDNTVVEYSDVIYQAKATFVSGSTFNPANWNVVGGTSGGPQGPQGSPGAQGPQGPQGPQGQMGSQGSQGSPGAQGSVGPQGATGSGSQGPQGPQGSQGATGAQGTPGSQGPQGGVGPQGTPGSQGPQGGVGPQGPQGPQGVTGSQGAQGAASTVAGPQGAQGPQGPQGAIGSQGSQGPAAWTGVTAWASGSTYTAGPPASVVTYGGSTYVALKASTGVIPGTDSSSWALVAQSGNSSGSEITTANNASATTITATALTSFGISVQPNVTVPIVLELTGLFLLQNTSSTVGKVIAVVEIVDDTGTVIGTSYVGSTNMPASTSDYRQLAVRLDVTPSSTSRIYNVQGYVSLGSGVTGDFVFPGTASGYQGNCLTLRAFYA